MNSIKPIVKVYPDLHTLSLAAATIVAESARKSVEDSQRFFWAVSGGGTPIPHFRMLANSQLFPSFPWLKTHLFWGDERCVPPDHPGSNYGLARKEFIEHVAIPKSHVHRIRGELDPASAADDYSSRLSRMAGQSPRWPIFDLVSLGLGDDGHTASLFPGSLVGDKSDEAAIPVTAEYEDRPVDRVTLTPVVINSARRILFLVSGASKASAVASVLEGPMDPVRRPAQYIRPNEGEIFWLLDKEAAAKLNSESMIEQ